MIPAPFQVWISLSLSTTLVAGTFFNINRQAMQIEKWDPKRDGPLTEKALRQKLEQRGYRVWRYVYSPRTYFPDHTHEVDKIDAVLSGRFRMKIGVQEFILEPGDCLAVPRGTVHSAEVVGDEPVVSLDATKE